MTVDLKLPLYLMAPEALTLQKWPQPSDVWSYACLGWHLMTGKDPHDKNSELVLAKAQQNVSIALEWEELLRQLPYQCPDKMAALGEVKVFMLLQLMQRCQTFDPYSRPSFGDIVNSFEQNALWREMEKLKMYRGLIWCLGNVKKKLKLLMTKIKIFKL